MDGENDHTVAAAAKIIQQSQTEARRYLSRLVEHGLVESRGRGRGASYQLSSATYRRLGLEQQYVRQRGFEPLQQDQLVLQYVAAHCRIARRDAAELCKVHPKQASRILARLTRRGELVMHGKKRGAWYGLPEDGDTKL